MPRKVYPRDPIDVEVGRRLRAFRLRRGFTQTEPGVAVALSFQQIQKYETGMNRLSASVMCRLAIQLGINPANLLPIDCSSEPHTVLAIDALQSKSIIEVVEIMNRMSALERTRAAKIVRLLAAIRARWPRDHR